VLHHEIGNPGWLPFYAALAERFTVYVPSFPGYGSSERPEWLRSVRDLAVLQQWLLRALSLDGVSLVGLGFGGWVAAEMASMSPRAFRRLVLVGAMGIQPANGEILDQAILGHHDYVRTGFNDQARCDAVFGAEPPVDQLEAWDINREMTFRIAWKPYMYSQTLPHLLGGVEAPALIVWGREDRIVPFECGELFRDALPRARLQTISDCGHFVEMEKPAELAVIVSEFVGATP
jgi:pimeloyl-ACP methyl ester carboxylesterase